MAKIDWDEFKEFRKTSVRDDNFEILLEFMKSYYNVTNTSEMFNILRDDDIAQMMLEKRSIDSAESLESIFFKV